MNNCKSLLLLLCLLLTLGCDSKNIEETFYPSGSLKSETAYNNGIQEGLKIEYYEDGNVKSKTEWKNGKQDGEAFFYYPDGKIESKSEWKNGWSDGYFAHYYANGKIRDYGHNKLGQPHGPYKVYYPNGTILQEGSYMEGVKHGEQKVYYKNGKLKELKTFINLQGKEIYTGIVSYDEDGSVKSESSRVVFEVEKDTLKVNEPARIVIKLKNPEFDSTFFVLSTDAFNTEFSVVDQTKMDTVVTDDHLIEYSILPKRKGHLYLRGLANNLRVEWIKGDTVAATEIHKYFEYPFYVKE